MHHRDVKTSVHSDSEREADVNTDLLVDNENRQPFDIYVYLFLLYTVSVITV